MGISGCTSCQLGGVEALKAYDRTYQVQLNNEHAKNLKVPDPTPISPNQASSENKPIAGASIGSNINISA